jgi:hypothetical protein
MSWKPVSGMGILRDPREQGPSAAQAPLPGAVSPTALPTSLQQGAETTAKAGAELQARRDALAEQVAELHWDLGGLAYEMAIRDHFRLDVLVRRAAVLQERDAELAELERLLRMEQDGVAGACPNCSAPHSRGALYCWQCGTTLMESRLSSASESDGAASVMDALLAQEVMPGSESAVGTDE